MTTFNWRLQGRCYKLGHDVPHAGGVIPNRLIVAREMAARKLIPHLFAEADPGFHARGITREYPPLPDALREIVEVGGNAGWLKQWWQRQTTAKTE